MLFQDCFKGCLSFLKAVLRKKRHGKYGIKSLNKGENKGEKTRVFHVCLKDQDRERQENIGK